MMIRGIMIVLVLCMMSLISAHPQQSLSPNQSLRAEARFVEAKGFKSQLEAWRASAKLKYCAIRAVVKKAGEKHPVAFFAAQTAAKIGAKTLVGIATVGISELVADTAAVIKTGYKTTTDYATELSKIKASTLTTSAKMACGSLSTGKALGAFMKDGLVAFVEVETGVNLQTVYEESGFGQALDTARTEVKGLVDQAAAGAPGFAQISEKLEADATASAEVRAERFFGFSCDQLCMLTKNVDQATQAAAGIADQNYCDVPGTFIIGKFRCQGGASTPVEGSSSQHRNAMTCEVMEGVTETEGSFFAAAKEWVEVVEGEVSDSLSADFHAAMGQ